MIFIGSDHGGFYLKNKITEDYEGIASLVDVGPFEINPHDDYPDFAEKVARKVADTPGSFGILICRSGNGMCIAANKIRGAYAALCFTKKHAEMARKDDNANILCLDSDYAGESPLQILDAFLSTTFAGLQTRHGRRFQKIECIEEKNFK